MIRGWDLTAASAAAPGATRARKLEKLENGPSADGEEDEEDKSRERMRFELPLVAGATTHVTLVASDRELYLRMTVSTWLRRWIAIFRSTLTVEAFTQPAPVAAPRAP